MSREEQERRLVVRVDERARVVYLTGELDLFTGELLAEQLEPLVGGRGPSIDVDMADIEFCDSSGLNALLKLRRLFDAVGRDLRITRPSEQVARLLALTGLVRSWRRRSPARRTDSISARRRVPTRCLPR